MKIIRRDDKIKLITFVHDNAIYQVTKSAFDESKLMEYAEREPKKYLVDNGKFKKYQFSDVEIIKIDHFSEIDVRKMKKRKFVIVHETPEMYQKYFNGLVKDEIPVEWIHNILSGKTEMENVLIKEDKFILTRDLKWNGKRDSLYLLVIFRDEKLYSIRSLREEHIEMLNRMKETVLKYCLNTFGFIESEIKMYFHYHPSYWHLHLHVQYVGSEIGTDSTFYAESVDDVIYNLFLDSEYYAKKTITIMQDTETLIY